MLVIFRKSMYVRDYFYEKYNRIYIVGKFIIWIIEFIFLFKFKFKYRSNLFICNFCFRVVEIGRFLGNFLVGYFIFLVIFR